MAGLGGLVPAIVSAAAAVIDIPANGIAAITAAVIAIIHGRDGLITPAAIGFTAISRGVVIIRDIIVIHITRLARAHRLPGQRVDLFTVLGAIAVIAKAAMRGAGGA